jgi:phenylpropionate dioxygenase-like ring-hydroxylating dioxygenase large terminal subunit
MQKGEHMTTDMFNKVYEGQWDRQALDYQALVDQWHVVTQSEDVPTGKPIAATLLGERVVLWRSENGRIQAWKDFCAHRGAPLSLGTIKNCRLVCPYHGWHFDHAGQCVHVPAHPDQKPPARSAVQGFRATEKYGFVWVSLGEPANDVPRLPHWDDIEFRKVKAGPYAYGANALRCLDNFMDASHFPHVHPGVNGRADEPDTTINYQVIEASGELRTTEFTVVQPFADGRGIPLTVHYHYYCLSPTVAYSDKQTGPQEHWFTWCAMTPVDVDKANKRPMYKLPRATFPSV